MIFKELSEEYYNLGIKLAHRNNLTSAIEALKKAATIDVGNWKILNVIGLCFYKKGDFLEAKDAWIHSTSLCREDKNDALTYLKSFDEEDFINICDTYNTVVTAVQEGNLNKSIKLLQDKDFPCFEYCKFTNMLGLIHLAKGEEHKAFSAFKRTLEIDSSNKDTKHYLNSSWENLNVKISIGERLKSLFVRS